MEHCSSKGFSYCGLIWGNQCGCGNNPPSNGDKKADAYCDTQCIGDYNQVCGGPGNSQVIYKLDGTQPPSTTSPPATSPQTTTSPPISCQDLETASWCESKCNSAKKCGKKRCVKKCAKTCNCGSPITTTSPPCQDTESASWCNSKCNSDTKCGKKRCIKKCSQTCNLCGNPTGPPTTSPPITGPPTTSRPGNGSCTTTKYDYAEVLEKSLLFYEAQRSGPLPADNRIPWRDDSAVDDLIVGGYYDGEYFSAPPSS